MRIVAFIPIAGILISTYAAAQASEAATAATVTRAGMYQQEPGQALLAAANPALLPDYKQLTATAFGEKRFLLDDLSLVQLGLVLPVSAGAFSVQVASLGSASYQQSKIALAYGHRLTERLNMGVQFRYRHFNISGYGNTGMVEAAAAVQFRCSPTLTAGLQADHIAGRAAGVWKGEKVPQVFSAGIGYAPAPSFYLDANLVKETAMPLGLQTSLLYSIKNQLQVKGGFSTAASLFYVGAGYRLGTLVIEATAAWHPHLSISPGVMVTYKNESH